MNPENILISRTDKAGDLLLTLPLFRELKKAFPDARLTAHVRRYTAPILKMVKQVDNILLDDDHTPELISPSLHRAFIKERFDLAIMVHPAGRAMIAAWRAGIAHRVGRASNIFQFFLNDRRIQKRSRNEKHEYQYNLDLLTGIVPNIDRSPWNFSRECLDQAKGAAYLAGAGLQNCRPIVVHPGHGGSAHNIGVEQYARIVESLLNKNIPTAVSLGPGEEGLLGYFPPPVPGLFGFIASIPDLAELAAVFANCSAFCGGSTGPLHLAAALQLPCAAFFPPVAAMTPARWGPVGCNSMIIRPELPECNGKCERCEENGCMSRLNTAPAVAWLTGEHRI